MVDTPDRCRKHLQRGGALSGLAIEEQADGMAVSNTKTHRELNELLKCWHTSLRDPRYALSFARRSLDHIKLYMDSLVMCQLPN